MQGIRVFVVDPHPVIRHGLAAMLASDAGLQWVGDAPDTDGAVRAAPALQPDVLLLNPQLRTPDGQTALTLLRSQLPQASFIVFDASADADSDRAEPGSVAQLPGRTTAAQLSAAIRQACGGLPDSHAAGSAKTAGTDLTQRERELLGLMAQGLSNQDIATRLSIAMPTVKFHVTHILDKLDADNRTEAVLVALKRGIVQLS